MLVLIFAMLLMGGQGPIAYTQSDMRAMCEHEGGEPGLWQYLILHHSGTSSGSAGAFDRYHRSKGMDELAYHFVIGNGDQSGDGEIEVGERWHKQKYGAHAGQERYNLHGIGICVVGDLESGDRLTDAQFEALVELCAYLIHTYRIPIDNVLRHSDVRSTKCPGVGFPFNALIRELTNRMATDSGEG